MFVSVIPVLWQRVNIVGSKLLYLYSLYPIWFWLHLVVDLWYKLCEKCFKLLKWIEYFIWSFFLNRRKYNFNTFGWHCIHRTQKYPFKSPSKGIMELFSPNGLQLIFKIIPDSKGRLSGRSVGFGSVQLVSQPSQNSWLVVYWELTITLQYLQARPGIYHIYL